MKRINNKIKILLIIIFISVNAYSQAYHELDNKVIHKDKLENYKKKAFLYKLAKVKGGTFIMGCTTEQVSDCEEDEKPAHSVTVSSFSIGKYEVTQAQWESIMGTNPSSFNSCSDCPVEQVSWDDIQIFLQKLNAKTGKNYRLPTEAEWEYAARGGNKSKGYKYSGSNDVNSVVWYEGNSDCKTHIIGRKAPNELGIYDMSGNVYEWCSDLYGNYNTENQTNPKGESMVNYRVLRSGSWMIYAKRTRVSYRDFANPKYRTAIYGFRLVLP